MGAHTNTLTLENALKSINLYWTILMYEAYKLLYKLIQLVCGGYFQEIFVLLTLHTYIYVEISNKNHQKIANKLEPGKDWTGNSGQRFNLSTKP